jgi:hypothetical protein
MVCVEEIGTVGGRKGKKERKISRGKEEKKTGGKQRK